MQSPKFSSKRSVMVLIVGTLLMACILLTVINPVERVMADRYIQKGNTQLRALAFEKAELSYLKALNLNPQSELAQQKLGLAKDGEVDIAKLRTYLAEQGQEVVVAKIDDATTSFATPKEALAQGIRYFEAGEYVYARYPLERALILDENYPEAMHYLSLTYGKLAEKNSDYREKAQELAKKRDILSPKWRDL